MKTASELAIEYWNKTPMERLHSTLQDYVYDYMNSQNERLRTQAIADAAEIARLQSGFEELKGWVEYKKHSVAIGYWDGYTSEEYVDADDLIKEINRITGVEK